MHGAEAQPPPPPPGEALSASAGSVSPAPLRISAEMLASPEPASSRIDFERGMSCAPVLTLILIAANIAVFAWQLSVGALDSQEAIIAAGALHRDGVLRGEVWRLASAMFLHGGFDHLLGNCLVLYVVGMASEHAFTRLSAGLIYFLSGLGGSVLSVAMSPGPSVGASGAIFGVCGAVVVFLYRFQDLFFVRDKRIGFVLLIWAAYSIVTGFLDPAIDNYAHIGGLIAGAALGFILPRRVRDDEPETATACGIRSHLRTDVRRR